MREDYTFYNCYCHDNVPIDFKAYVLNQLRDLGYFNWLRDEPRWIKEEEDFLNSTQRIPYIEREIKRDQKRIREAKEFLKQIKEHPDEEYGKYVKDETEKWQAQYNTKINNKTDYATERIKYLKRRADELQSFLNSWETPDEYYNVTETLNNQLLTVRKEAKEQQEDRKLFYDNLEDKPVIASEEVYLEDIKEQCEDIIKRSRNWISDNKRNIERMKKQDEATHKLFESFKQLGL
jgi:hypothetical protein